MCRKVTYFFIMCGAAALVGLITASLFFGSFDRAVAFLAGRQVVLQPTNLVVDIDEGESPRRIFGRFLISNLSGRRLRVLGVEVGCGCISVGKFPFDVSPGSTERIEVVLDVAAFGRNLEPKPVKFFTDSPVGRQLPATVAIRFTGMHRGA